MVPVKFEKKKQWKVLLTPTVEALTCKRPPQKFEIVDNWSW